MDSEFGRKGTSGDGRGRHFLCCGCCRQEISGRALGRCRGSCGVLICIWFAWVLCYTSSLVLYNSKSTSSTIITVCSSLFRKSKVESRFGEVLNLKTRFFEIEK